MQLIEATVKIIERVAEFKGGGEGMRQIYCCPPPSLHAPDLVPNQLICQLPEYIRTPYFGTKL